ncbi:uncharacterized protein [Rutidosis leptorrhynchoides]|uniref:uncharacterized protein n=1 Tax=Rutidosis leptorrhynchoides TaxID=125765 RepID=UPI003A9A40D6
MLLFFLELLKFCYLVYIFREFCCCCSCTVATGTSIFGLIKFNFCFFYVIYLLMEALALCLATACRCELVFYEYTEYHGLLKSNIARAWLISSLLNVILQRYKG